MKRTMKFVNSLNNSLDRLLGNNTNVILYGEDLLDPYGGAFKVSKGLSTKYPAQVLSTPISEATIVGMAAGMSIAGLRPIVEIMFGDFLSIATDQLLNHLTKYDWMYNGQVKTPVTIRTAMGGRRGYGPTHSQSLEPLMASIPLLEIIAPSDYHDPGKLLETAVLNDDSVKIFSEHKLLYPRELKSCNAVPEGLSVKYNDSLYPTAYLSNCHFDNPDVLLVSFGGNSIIIEELMIDLLLEYELNIEAVLPSRIKPFPYTDIINKVNSASCIFFIEESPVTYGWSSEIIAHLTETNIINGKNVSRIGAMPLPIPSSTYLEEQILPSKELIISKITNSLNL